MDMFLRIQGVKSRELLGECFFGFGWLKRSASNHDTVIVLS